MRAVFTAGLVLLSTALAPVLAAAAESSPRFFVGAGASLALTDGLASVDDEFRVASAPIDGLPFDDEAVAWRAFVGWSPAEHWSVEAGYVDFGSFSSEELFFGAMPLAVPALSPTTPLPPSLIGGSAASFVVAAPVGGAELTATAWTLAGTYSRPFADRWYGALSAGVLRATFDVEGGLPFWVGPAFPGVLELLPFATPENEIGWLWGVAVGWQFAPAWSAELAYRQYELDVVRVETVGLDLRWSF